MDHLCLGLVGARLLAVSRDGDWTGWCGFFLRAIIEQAGTNPGEFFNSIYQSRCPSLERVDSMRQESGCAAFVDLE